MKTKYIKILLTLTIFACGAHAQRFTMFSPLHELYGPVAIGAEPLYPGSETAQTKVELGVEGIRRICPTGMWDHWIFRDILYDRKSKTVLLIIQRYDDGFVKEEVQEEAERIISQFKKAYESLIKKPHTHGDGDFMLYLSIGTLFKEMEEAGDVNLRIMYLKPDYTNQVFGETPLVILPGELEKIKPEKTVVLTESGEAEGEDTEAEAE